MDSTLKSIRKMSREYEEEIKQNKSILVKKTINLDQTNIHNLSAYVGFLSSLCYLLNFLFIRK
jgi:hypothetical protein